MGVKILSDRENITRTIFYIVKEERL